MKSTARIAVCLTFITVVGQAAQFAPREPFATVDVRVTSVEMLLTPGEMEDVSRVSWYGPGFHGRLTASGKKYDMDGISAAHREFKFGTKVLFVNFKTGESLVVPVTDRGPYAKWKGKTYYEGERDFDLSKGAGEKLSVLKDGVVPLHWIVLS